MIKFETTIMKHPLPNQNKHVRMMKLQFKRTHSNTQSGTLLYSSRIESHRVGGNRNALHNRQTRIKNR